MVKFVEKFIFNVVDVVFGLNIVVFNIGIVLGLVLGGIVVENYLL